MLEFRNVSLTLLDRVTMGLYSIWTWVLIIFVSFFLFFFLLFLYFMLHTKCSSYRKKYKIIMYNLLLEFIEHTYQYFLIAIIGFTLVFLGFNLCEFLRYLNTQLYNKHFWLNLVLLLWYKHCVHSLALQISIVFKTV